MTDRAFREIRSCYLFSDTDDQSVNLLARSSIMVRYNKGGTVFSAGDEPDGLRVVLSGLVRIWISDADGREFTLALVEPGDPFGEIGLLDGLPRTANATVLEGCECLYLPNDGVDRAMKSSSEFTRQMMARLCEILRRNTEAMGAFAFMGLDMRLARKLHDLALVHARLDGHGAHFTRKFSQHELAQMLGVTREALNKKLNVLAHDGLITRTNGLMSIPNLRSLDARAQAAKDIDGAKRARECEKVIAA